MALKPFVNTLVQERSHETGTEEPSEESRDRRLHMV
jgi:hypothetical protein